MWLRRIVLAGRLRIGRVGICPGCARFKASIERRRQLSQYHNDESNWLTACQDCNDEADEYWRERWQEYYSGVL